MEKWITPAAVLACTATLALAGIPQSKDETCPRPNTWQPCFEPGSIQQQVYELLRYQTFMALPESQRETITQRLGVENLPTIERGGEVVNPWAGLAPQPEEKYQEVAEFVDHDTFYSFEPIHQRMLVTIAERVAEGEVPPGPCFAPGTDEKLIAAFRAAMQAGINQNADRFQQTSRWGATALNNTPPYSQGSPTTLTYSYVPDGTFVPNLIGVSGNSNFQSWMNGIYGSPASWQPIFDFIFSTWGDLSGITYVYEPNDDGVNLNGASGSAGVRGDLRIAAIFIDGNSNVLAYNNFPQDGDMVLDSGDSFFSNTGSGSLRLRNVATHEHGHGFGALHVCPINGTKLMEPFVNLSFDGPQLDDILNVQRLYGDQYEPNDTAAQATSLGSLSAGITDVFTVSSDDNTDVDWYAFSITSAKDAVVTMTPTGATYDSSPQSCGGTGNCCSGNFINTQIFNNLGVEIIDTNGSTVLDSANSGGAGVADTATANLPVAGTYYARVFSGSSNNIQAYKLRVDLADAAIPACSEADITTQGAGSGDPGYGVPDGAVTAADLNYFVNAWVFGDLTIADVTTQGAGIGDPGYGVPDGGVTAADLNYYVNLWVIGCP